MNTDEDIDQFKRRVERQELKRARSTAVVLACASVIALLSIVYAYVQGIEAKRQRVISEIAVHEALEWKARAEAAERSAVEAQELAVNAQRRAEEALKRTEVNLKNANKRK